MNLRNTPVSYIRYLHLPMLLLSFSTSLFSLSGTAQTTTNWADTVILLTKEMKSSTLSFKYPDKWDLEKEKTKYSTMYSITPEPMKGTSIKTFQIQQINKQGISFNEFGKMALEYKPAEGAVPWKVINKRKDTFKNNETLEFQLFYLDKDSILSSVYLINARQFFYMVIIVGDKEKNALSRCMDKTTAAMLASVSLK